MATTVDEVKTMTDDRVGVADAWRRSLPALALALVALVGLYWETALSIVAIWYRSETFAHGFVVVPIVAWLIARQRAALAAVTPRPQYGVTALVLLVGLAWLVAHVVGILVLEQLAFVTLIPLVIWLLLGWGVVREVLFPLAFLFFGVPMGEELILPLMDFTAAFTVAMLRLTGIPVYVDGTFFTIPSGSWSVVEGCSGIRYLIASITLGTLYAYLTYRSYWRRAVFIALSVIVPIFANGMRAYIIVMIAHLSDHKLAHGIDHFIYGWVWFGVVMLVLFWLGSYWRDDLPTVPAAAPGAAVAASGGAGTGPGPSPALAQGARLVPVLIVTLTAVAAPPLTNALISRIDREAATVGSLSAPPGAAGWTADPVLLADWEPRYVGMDATVHRTYRSGQSAVGLYVALYAGAQQGQELVNSQNVLVRQKHPKWRMPRESSLPITLSGRPATVLEGVLRSEAQDFLTWRWHWIGAEVTVNPVVGKLLQARNKLLMRRPTDAGVVIYTPLEASPEEARRVLQRFTDDMTPAIEESIAATRWMGQPAGGDRSAVSGGSGGR